MYEHILIANYLNGKLVNQLNPNMLQFISSIYRNVNGNNMIECSILNDNNIKPNVCITINGVDRYVSMLNGNGNSVHEETPNSFEQFISSLNASANVRSFFHDLCFSANHTTGFVEAERINNPTRLSDARQFLQANRIAIIERAMIHGTHNVIRSEYVYVGTVDAGISRNINDVVRILNNIQLNRSLLPIGGLSLQRKDRFVNNNIQIKWTRPEFDLRNP